jgi:hypothetical protein
MNQEQARRQAYVERILQLYRQAPETPARHSRLDRRLAAEFYEQQIQVEQVCSFGEPAWVREKNVKMMAPIGSDVVWRLHLYQAFHSAIQTSHWFQLRIYFLKSRLPKRRSRLSW